ncbi:MtrAB system histidine kinase MtrB [Cumulibacter soli]|uniref:MtrAB system histidine kinase MtrB n=1 Tax=Cumulibacter soli TaxID=2546344 RepID=UPI001067AECE|nr:MtrAB system histidine kinase MtrB [Cumulibacter soli]
MSTLEAVRARVGNISARLISRWRRSLQLRVVALTLVLTATVVAVIGYILITQISTQLLRTKTSAAVEQTTGGSQYIQNELDTVGADAQSSANETVRAAVQYLQGQGTSAGQFWMMAASRDADGQLRRPIRSEPTLYIETIPVGLTEKVRDGNVAQQLATISLRGTTQQVLIVGSPVPGDRGFEVYYVYPLANEVAVMDFVVNTVVSAALAFLILIPGIGLLVSRLVVLPIRQASRTAQRLAEGDLQQRMDVRGEDDLARLGTSFNEMAASLSSQIIRLEALSQVQQRFSSDVSHELRTPLTTVRMAADLLYDYREEFPEAAARSAELMSAELDRFEALLKDLLEISRYDAGGLELDAAATDVAELIRDCVEGYRSLAAEHGCELIVHIDGELGQAQISPRRIERVLRNLLANALEHGANAPVEIHAATDGHVLAIGVRDYGVGIDAVAAARLFDRFWRADPSRVRKLGGTGLGMAISVEDVRLHLGWLHVWGAPGRGAFFRMTVPVRVGDVVTHSALPLVPEGEYGGSVGGVPELMPAPPRLELESPSSRSSEQQVIDP